MQEKQLSPIESFIRKYRTAQSAKAKELRITFEEATDLIAAFALINNGKENINQKLDNILKSLTELKSQDSEDTYLDGGKF